MVKIDGIKIRTIREKQGLTQLYVATAVEVTTDTVSRWENRRYPTIKKENAQRLAKALDVELDAILDSSDPKIPEAEVASASPAPVAESTSEPQQLQATGHPQAISSPAGRLKKWLLAASGLAVIAAAIGWTAWFFLADTMTPETQIDLQAARIAPDHFISGQPLPIFIRINGPTDREISIIIKETLPPGANLVASAPAVSGTDKKEHSIKWLTKVNGTAIFSYSLKTDPSYQGQLSYSGNIKVTGAGTTEHSIAGSVKSQTGLHHWADSNNDNRISDEEILTVYDLAKNESEIGIDMDLIEEMWLGDGYIWHPDTQRFSIIE